MEEKKFQKLPSGLKELSVGMLYYTSASIFGPLIFFGGTGYLLDLHFETKPIILIVGIFVAFITTNVLIYKKIKILMKKFDQLDKIKKEKEFGIKDKIK